MRAPARLALSAAGLLVAFGGAYGLAGVIVPDSAVEPWQAESRHDEHEGDGAEGGAMNGDDQDGRGADGAGAHDHPADGGAPPEGIRPAADPRYVVGAEVRLTVDHMAGMDGAEATVSGAFETTTYSVTYPPTTGGDPVIDHRWVVHEELDHPGPAPLAPGAEAVLLAEHMPGMRGATATVVSATRETVYTVDLTTDGMTMTNHKWVVESEMRPVD